MKTQRGVLGVMTLLVMTLFTVSAFATDAQLYFSSDKNGQNRVTNIQEGGEIWIVVIDNDQNMDCDIRDKMSPDLKIMDPKTGAYIVWNANADFDPEAILADDDYLEETGADTGVFVSVRAFQVGSRLDYAAGAPWRHTHVVDVPVNNVVDDFQWGHYDYDESDEGDTWGGVANTYPDNRGTFVGPASATDPVFDFGMHNPAFVPDRPDNVLDADEYLIGRFENMDTLIGMYQDPNDATDVGIGMMKIIDTEATIAWNQEIYKDANGTASITVVDPDENLNCNEVEYVPVFIIVNPGSWNPVDGGGINGGKSPTNFCMLLRTGGVTGVDPDVAGPATAAVNDVPIRWYNIYNADANAAAPISAGNTDGLYYIEYPVEGDDNVSFFRTIQPSGITRVLFYAQETGANTGVFQLNLNSILRDLTFEELNVRDVLVAYYLDPNDADDFKLATAYIEEKQHSITSFIDENRTDKTLFWIGRDPVYIQVIDANANVDPCCPEQVVVHVCDPHGDDDAEWLILDETSSNSPVFFTFAGTQLLAAWDALGVGLANSVGGWQLALDNWKLEAYNEDDVYVRYNDVYYGAPNARAGDVSNNVSLGLAGLGDWNIRTSFPPLITRGGSAGPVAVGPKALYAGVRVANDVSFGLMSIADTQVYDGSSVNMYFLDRQGNRVSGYANSDCVFIEVVDSDQDEDQHRRERIDAYWDGGQNAPFGAAALRDFQCNLGARPLNPINPLLGDTNIFNDEPVDNDSLPKLYVLNPRSGFWAAVDLLETGPATGDFVSVICIDLADVYECVPQLGVLPGDTIVAFYQDPSNHSDSAMISIKVGVGGGGTPPSQQSTTMFVDANGDEVSAYTDADTVYVKVIDPSHAAGSLTGALTVDGHAFDLAPVDVDGEPSTFMTAGLDLDLVAGETVTATYTDPTDLTDTSADTITVIASVLAIDSFYAGPNPFETEVTFGFNGAGVASQMTVTIYNLAGGVVYETTQTDVSEIVWDGAGTSGAPLANGCYIYVITATDGTNTFDGNGKVFVNR
ncbi:gliding motility-associated C-terminal domain-containing protein [Candidatus Bipolaricaulota bacterium]|nr:gliding motility-associated C-terminal domain-containing protein [Candidatus Bipolaricaulota bacterium]